MYTIMLSFPFLFYFFTMLCSKVLFSLPAQKRECGIVSPGMVENSISDKGIKRTTPKHMFNNLTFDLGVNLHVLWTDQLFTSLVV